MLIRLFIVVFLVLASASPSMAQTEDGYSSVGAGYYTDSAGDYYTREKYYWGYYTYYGQSYPRYWYWRYVPASKPVSSLTPRSSDADWVAFLAQREKIAGSIRANQEREDAFLARLKAVGVTPPFPGVPNYPGIGSSYNKLAVLQGNTIYGAYSYSQVADLYNQTDLNVLFQQSAALVKGAQGLASDGNAQFSAIVQQASAGAARVAEIKAQGEIDVEKLRMLRPPNRVVTTINGQTVAPAPGPMDKVDDGQAFAANKVAVVKADCLQCHSGAKAEGKLDLSKGISAEQYLAVLNRVSLPVGDKRHMPQGKDGAAGRQLNYNEIKSLLP